MIVPYIKCKEVGLDFLLPEDHVIEPKLDGIWVAVRVCDGGSLIITSRAGRSKIVPLPHPPDTSLDGCIFIGELGFGSQASLKRQAEVGGIYIDIFDIFSEASAPLRQRREVLERLACFFPERWFLVPQFARTERLTQYEKAKEGIVLKPLNQTYNAATWYKMKKTATYNYVLMGVEMSTAATKAAEPMAASLILGLYHGSSLKPVTKCAGLTHEQCRFFGNHRRVADLVKAETVVEVKAYKRFNSGALRHPSFIRIRDDKSSKECL